MGQECDTAQLCMLIICSKNTLPMISQNGFSRSNLSPLISIMFHLLYEFRKRNQWCEVSGKGESCSYKSFVDNGVQVRRLHYTYKLVVRIRLPSRIFHKTLSQDNTIQNLCLLSQFNELSSLNTYKKPLSNKRQKCQDRYVYVHAKQRSEKLCTQAIFICQSD